MYSSKMPLATRITIRFFWAYFCIVLNSCRAGMAGTRGRL
jgi:hypothetical protein